MEIHNFHQTLPTQKMTTKLTENAIFSMLSWKTHIQPLLQIVEIEPITLVQS